MHPINRNVFLYYGSKKFVHPVIFGHGSVHAHILFGKKRNEILFKQKKRTQEQVTKVILSTIRLKLLTFHFKRTTRVERVLNVWKLPSSLVKILDT